MNEKVMSILLATGLSVAGLVGYSNDAPKDENKVQSTDDGKTVVKLWLDYDEYAEALEEAVEAKYPQYDIQWEHVESTDTRTKLELDGPAGVGPDIFIQPHDGMAQSIQSQILLPLGEKLTSQVQERFIEGSVQTVEFDGTYYGVPLSTESVAFFYNKTLLDKYGFEVAETWDEIKAQGDEFNNTAENKFIIRMETGNSYTMHFFLTAFGYQLFGPDHNDPEKINFNTQEVIDGLTYYQLMRKYLDVPYADLTTDTVEVEFAKGNVPYIITGPWSIAEVRNQNTGFEWGITTIPTINGVQPETFSGNIIACISAYTQHVAESKQVLEFLASEEGLKILYDVKGSIPALKDNSVIEGVLEDPYVSGILAQAEFSQPMPILPEMSSYWGPVETMYRSVWEGLATPEQAAEKALADYNAALELAQ